MKKIVSLLLAVLMIFSLTATAFAADDASKPLKIIFTDERGYVLKEINVAYGEDYTSKAPEDTTIDGGYKTYITGWESDLQPGVVMTTLPVINAADGFTELTFKASYTTVEVTAENVIGGVVDEILGENTTDLFTSFIQLIKEFIQQFIMYLMNFGM